MNVIFEDAPVKCFDTFVEVSIPASVVRSAVDATRGINGEANKISAIKELRRACQSEFFGIRVGLREAKEMVEAIMAEANFQSDTLPF